MFARVGETLVALLAGGAIFGSPSKLSGPLLYDDKAAVQRNPVVTGEVPLGRVWAVDFWGEHEMHTAESHKSFRPVVTLSYRLNFMLHEHDAWGYHVVNAAVHAVNCALVPPVVRAAFGWQQAGGLVPLATALLFAVHPVHPEAVQQIVGRAELLMALFFLLGFLGYASVAVGREACVRGAAPTRVGARGVAGCAVALACTLLATLSKETGVTLPLLCVGWEGLIVLRLRPAETARELVSDWRRERRLRARRQASPAEGEVEAKTEAGAKPVADATAQAETEASETKADAAAEASAEPDVAEARPEARPEGGGAPRRRAGFAAAFGRGALLGVGLGTLVVWRHRLNGGTKASISVMQNVPAFLPHRGWRAVSVCWVWAEYLWSAALPLELSPDWSYPAIPPIEDVDDVRLPLLLLFCAGWLAFWWFCLLSATAPRLLVAVVGFGLVPFVLASNLLFAVGTCKAERVLYLPSLGACMAAALALDAASRWLCGGGDGDGEAEGGGDEGGDRGGEGEECSGEGCSDEIGRAHV